MPAQSFSQMQVEPGKQNALSLITECRRACRNTSSLPFIIVIITTPGQQSAQSDQPGRNVLPGSRSVAYFPVCPLYLRSTKDGGHRWTTKFPYPLCHFQTNTKVYPAFPTKKNIIHVDGLPDRAAQPSLNVQLPFFQSSIRRASGLSSLTASLAQVSAAVTTRVANAM